MGDNSVMECKVQPTLHLLNPIDSLISSPVSATLLLFLSLPPSPCFSALKEHTGNNAQVERSDGRRVSFQMQDTRSGSQCLRHGCFAQDKQMLRVIVVSLTRS